MTADELVKGYFAERMAARREVPVKNVVVIEVTFDHWPGINSSVTFEPSQDNIVVRYDIVRGRGRGHWRHEYDLGDLPDILKGVAEYAARTQ